MDELKDKINKACLLQFKIGVEKLLPHEQYVILLNKLAYDSSKLNSEVKDFVVTYVSDKKSLINKACISHFKKDVSRLLSFEQLIDLINMTLLNQNNPADFALAVIKYVESIQKLQEKKGSWIKH
jgi:hypothetical protein